MRQKVLYGPDAALFFAYSFTFLGLYLVDLAVVAAVGQISMELNKFAFFLKREFDI